jgi:hypothetical protein
MKDRPSTIRDPVRVAMRAAAFVSFLGSFAVFSPADRASPARAVAFAIGHGVFLGWLVIGVLLAPKRRWVLYWIIVIAAMPIAAMMSLLAALKVAPGWLMPILWLESSVLVASLASGCVFATRGWWSYATGVRMSRDALSSGANSSPSTDPLP